MGWLDEMAEASTSGGSNFFKDGRGRVIVKDVKVFKGYKDKYTYTLECVVKSAQSNTIDADGKPVPPNPVGQTVGYTQLLTKFESAKSNAKKANVAILGPEAEALSPDKLKEEFNELMRIDEAGPLKGYTNPAKPCPARGVELSFETRRQMTRDGSKELTLVEFRSVPMTKELIEQNRALLDAGASGSTDAAEEAPF
jgi:hypothetical protein